MDAAATRWINGFAGLNPLLDTLAIWMTGAGVPVLVALVVLQWWARRDRLHVRHAAVSAGLAFLLGLAMNQLLLLMIHRVRPYDDGVSNLLIAPSADWSFPSDHATASMAIAAAFFLARLPGRAAVFLVFALAICLSRVFVGTHYVGDVLGGAATGILAAVVVRLVYRENSRLDRFATGLL
jgi:undecaprenyl-diphosphatase